ncbi:MAG: hypothetical protein ACYC6A_12105 [Armatimonadota bacterium]
MPESEPTKAERRIDRALVLTALVAETGSHGGPAAASVKAYIDNPEGASAEQFAYVGGLLLERFYVDPGKPSRAEQQSLWQNLGDSFDLPADAECPDLVPSLTVGQLQAIVEEAAG